MDDVTMEFKYKGEWVPMTNRNMFQAIDDHFWGGVQVWFDDYANVWGDKLELGDLYIEDKRLGKINLTITSWEWLIEEVMHCETRD